MIANEKTIILNWKPRSDTGWGLVALNLLLHFANKPNTRVSTTHAVQQDDLALLDPIRAAVLSSHAFPDRNYAPAHDAAWVINPNGNRFPSPRHERGAIQISRCIFEDTSSLDKLENLQGFDYLLTASNWNADLLGSTSQKKIKVIPEGVDHSLFHPGPKSGILPHDRFYIYSPGKVEYRKAQDLTIRAFKIFYEQHPDAVLVTAWHSPWPELSAGYRGTLEHSLRLNSAGQIDVTAWLQEAGLPSDSFIDLGRINNFSLPAVIREMDVSLHPSRAEACSCLPMLEAMATGVPVIASYNTGLCEVVKDSNALVLRSQGVIDSTGCEGWGESDVDEILAHLEFAYQNREVAKRLGGEAREILIREGRTWQEHARTLHTWLFEIGTG